MKKPLLPNPVVSNNGHLNPAFFKDVGQLFITYFWKPLCCLSLCVILTLGYLAYTRAPPTFEKELYDYHKISLDDQVKHFESWKIEFDITFPESEEEQRFNTFVENCKKISKHNANAESHGFWMHVNPFAGYSEKEFHRKFASGLIEEPENGDKTQHYFKASNHGSTPRRRLASDIIEKDLGLSIEPEEQEVGRIIELSEQNEKEITVSSKESDLMDSNGDVKVPEGAPAALDWQKLGKMTPVKRQEHCGACYIFSASAAIEGRCMVKNWPAKSISTQRILDCLPGDHGCKKGLQSHVYKFGIKQDGYTIWEDYDDYHADAAPCHGRNDHIHSIYGFGRMAGDKTYPAMEQRLIKHLQWGPVSAAVCTHTGLLQYYGRGTIKGASCTSLSHGIALVGYGEEEETGNKFWKIKNSWGTRWGINGYAKICRGTKCGTKSRLGFLGIVKQIFYPECKEPNTKWKDITKNGPPKDTQGKNEEDKKRNLSALFRDVWKKLSESLPEVLKKW